ncbi:flagellar hook-associated protein 3 FlgL [Kineococcus radiotolerans]|uniref:Flagellar hook-associated protein 3 FlgL n=1 Tax=Kineococcus radiotolerans TaxID=131568 RepID=A0A7W4TIS2_KINRA|nr:flagellar hook-associated protein FlgL [Kineococcus radiotolerans]MBB2899684.1 flagellar hook-associated protein 3 FlgL [Kineococcus radiotolerans]
MTQRSIATNALTNLQNTQTRMAKLQEQITSGNSLPKGSEDSVRAAAALRLNDQIAVNTENGRNLDEARAWMTTQEPALQSTTNALQKVRALTVQAGNGALDETGRKAIAAEILALKETILGDANTPYQGRAVFGGTTAGTAAYGAAPTYTYAGDANPVERTISPGVKMTVNILGESVYGAATPGGDSLFAQLDKLAADITGGTLGANVTLGDLDKRITGATNAMAVIGARTNQLDHAEEVNANQLAYLEAQLNDVQGVDPAKAYVEFTQQNVAYQAALQVTAKTVQTSLLDFLR